MFDKITNGLGRIPSAIGNWCDKPDRAWERKARRTTVAVAAIILPLILMIGLQRMSHAAEGVIMPSTASVMPSVFSPMFYRVYILGASLQTYMMFYTLMTISGVGLKLLLDEIIPRNYRGTVYRVLFCALPIIMIGTGGVLVYLSWNQSHSVIQTIVSPHAAKAGLIIAGASLLTAAYIPVALRGAWQKPVHVQNAGEEGIILNKQAIETDAEKAAENLDSKKKHERNMEEMKKLAAGSEKTV